MPLMIAIDLGSHSVKVSTWRSAGRRVEPEDRFSFPVPQDGTPPTLQARLAALDALRDENPAWAGGSATLGLVLPGSEASFRPLEMPFTDKSQVEKTLPFTIEGEVPYELEDMVLGWRSARLEDRSRVMAVLARREVVSTYLGALQERGMDPRDLVADGELLGAYGTDQCTAVIDIGHTHTIVSVVQGREVRASRAINVGGWNFTRAIQQALGCEWGHAEAVKHGTARSQADADDEVTDPGQGQRSGYASLPQAARAAVDAAIGQLLAEVRSTLLRFEDTLHLDVVEVRICGGSARIPELREYLAQDLGVPVSKVVDPDGNAVPPPFAVAHAMGRTVAGLSSGERPIDLRVADLAFRGGVNTLRAVLTYGGAGAAFFVVAAVIIFTVQYVSLLREQSEVNGRITAIVTETFPEVPADKIAGPTEALGIMTAFTADAASRSAELPPANPDKPPTVDRLYHLVGTLPPHDQVPVELTSLELLPELLQFEGETTGFAQSAQIEEALKASDAFKTGNKESESRTADGKVKFTFRIPLDKSGEAG